MQKCVVVCLGLWLALGSPLAEAQDEPADAKAIEMELDRFRDDLFRAFNEGDYQLMLEKFCHKDIIATWQDGTSSQGHAGVIAEFDKLKKFINKMTVHPTTDKRLILNDGNLVISSGEMRDDYSLSRGIDVNLRSRWSATLVKVDDRWWLSSFSASTNAFENEVVDLYLKNQKYTTAAIAGLIGLVGGVVATRAVASRGKTGNPDKAHS